jgi:peptide/nickel transport system substrate-binding protein
LNGDGIVDREIDGELVSMELDYLYPVSDQARRTIGTILQREAEKIGIKISFVPLELDVGLERLQDSEFDLFCLGFEGESVPEEPKQMWHSEAYESGFNFTGFGDAYSDSLIKEIRTSIDEQKRQHLYCRFQEVVHERVPAVFLYSLQQRMLINNNYENLNISSISPSCWVAGFQQKHTDTTAIP